MIDCMLCFNIFCLFSYLFMSVCCVTLCCIVLYCIVVIIKVANKTSSLLWLPYVSRRALVAKIRPDKFV